MTMALFKVPGWSISTAPIQEDLRPPSRKRKRSGSIVTEDLDRQLKKSTHEQGSQESQVHAKKGKERFPDQKLEHVASVTRLSKKKKKEKQPQVFLPVEAPDKSVMPLTNLQRRMKETLDGARFRLINETLYKAKSQEACRMIRQDPKMFEEYHVGFRHQVLSWPTNPVDYYTKKFSTYPQKTVIADLGCGDAILAKRLLTKGISVISFDLVSDDAFVVAADICDKIPLPGSEGTPTTMGEGQVVDVVVCALSLMGTNWIVCIREAWRILKANGQLYIAEVTSRFTDLQKFVSLITSIGFRLKSKDASNTHFMLFEFSKISRQAISDKECAKLRSEGSVLKPCEYKRR